MSITDFYVDNTGFKTFGLSHILAMVFSAVFGFFYIGTHIMAQERKTKEQGGHIIGWTLCFVNLGWILTRILIGKFSIQEDLPLNLCNLCAILLPLLMYHHNKVMFNIFYFLIMAGTTQAILTPNLYDAFPHYTFFKYFIVHCGLVIAVLYLAFVFNLRPTIKGMFTAFLAIQAYVIFLMIVNYFIGSNYAYVCHKPDTPSMLDYMGPHPWYILGGEFVAVIFFIIYYIPFYLKDRDIRKRIERL